MSSFGGSSTSRRASASAVEDASRKIVAPWLDVARRVRGDRRLRVRPPGPRAASTRSGSPARWASTVERPRAAVHALDQALARELLQVAVDRDRGDRVVARQVGDGHAAVALDALEDLGPAECGWHRVQTRSTNSLRRTRHLERAELVDRPHEVVGVAVQRLLALLRRRAHRVADHARARELAVVHREDEVLVALELDVRARRPS